MLLEDYASVLGRADLDPGGIEISLGEGCRIAGREEAGGLDVVTIDASGGAPIRVSLELPLGDAEGYWYPNSGHLRTLPPDWRGSDKTSIISSSPLGCLYDRHGRSILAFGFDQQIEESLVRFGVSEEHKSFVVYYEHKGKGRVRLALAPAGEDHADAVGRIRDWLRDDVGPPLPVPYDGTVPVYCTWYAFSQAVDARKVEREAGHAAALGCRAVIIDDGWQRLGSGRLYAGCGDWVPDPEKFPDMAGHVKRLDALGLSVMLWVAPFLLGPKSDAYLRMRRFAPHHSEGLRAAVLDPRFPETREFFVETCVRLVRDYGLSGLKIDFLDTVVVYQGTATEGDIKDVGAAVQATLRQLVEGLKAAGLEDALIEFRQTYIGPATAAYGNLLRAGDCPADAVVNRRSVVDTRMIAAGQAVHADPVLWDHRAGPEPVARQLLNAYFGVPQISMPLSTIPEAQRQAVSAVLKSWMSTRKTVLSAQLRAGLPSENYPVIEARAGDRSVVGIYQPAVVELDLDGLAELTLLNATPGDSVAIRWRGRPRRIVGETRTATGELAALIDTVAAPGLKELGIPVSGIASMRVADA